jgi:hypothetical protein
MEGEPDRQKFCNRGARREDAQEGAHGVRLVNQIFRDIPDSDPGVLFVLGTTVEFPRSEKGNEISQWEIVSAEKGHYLLETQTKNTLFDHVVFSEEELLRYNPLVT